MICTHRINPACGVPRFLVALSAVPDLFICAKHLFFPAIVTTDGRQELRRRLICCLVVKRAVVQCQRFTRSARAVERVIGIGGKAIEPDVTTIATQLNLPLRRLVARLA